MRVYVYENKRIGNSSNGGLSATHHVLELVMDGERGPRSDEPQIRLNTKGHGYIYAEPVEPKPEGTVGWMMGGSFVHSSDSRFPYKHPVPLHDRCETQAEYDLLSR